MSTSIPSSAHSLLLIRNHLLSRILEWAADGERQWHYRKSAQRDEINVILLWTDYFFSPWLITAENVLEYTQAKVSCGQAVFTTF